MPPKSRHDMTSPPRPLERGNRLKLTRMVGVSVCVIAFVVCLYLGSLGPVMYYYKTHPPAVLPPLYMITLSGTGTSEVQHARRSVHLPSWVAYIYAPVLKSRCGRLGPMYSSYLFWWVDRKGACYRNLSRLDAAKRKWALATKKSDGDTPFASHIYDLLPEGTRLKCPTGGDYILNPVGDRPRCTIHGSDF